MRWDTPPARRTGLVVLAVVATLVTLSGCGTSSQAQPASSTAPDAAAHAITVQAQGRVSGRPDTARLMVGVQARGQTASAALAQASQRTQAALDALKAAGVADADLQTSNLSVSPQYSPGAPSVDGYQASNSVVATIRDVGEVGDVVDATVGKVGEGVVVQGVSFTIEDTGSLMATARKRAVDAARTQAQQLADAAGVSLGGVRSVTEGGGVATPVARSAASSASTVPVEAGTQELQVLLTVSFDVS